MRFGPVKRLLCATVFHEISITLMKSTEKAKKRKAFHAVRRMVAAEARCPGPMLPSNRLSSSHLLLASHLASAYLTSLLRFTSSQA